MPAIQTQNEAVEWYKIITDWPNAWESMQRNFQGLLAQSNYVVTKHPELRAEYDALVRKGSELFTRGVAINNSVNSIKSAWDTFTGWVKGLAGLSSMGILPAIPVAVSAASAVALFYSIGAWLREAAAHARKLEVMKELEAKGVAPAEAARAAGDMAGDSGPSLFGIPIKWLIVGGIALMILPTVLPLLKRGR